MPSNLKLKNVMFISSIAKNKWGGVEKWMFEVGNGLSDNGYKVIYCGRPGSKFIEMSNIKSFKYYTVKFTSDFNPFVSYKLRNIATKEKIDLICVGREKDLRLLSLAYIIGQRPTVIMRKGLALIKNRWRFKIVYEHFVDLIITPSSALKNHLLGLLPWLNGDRIHVINNGVAIPDKIEKGLFRKELSISDKTFLAVIIGRLSDQKGQNFFLKALSLVKDELNNTQVVIIGDGEEENELRNEVKNLGLSEIVKFISHRWDVPNILTDADLLVHPSLYEGMPNLILEALAQGTPVLATDIPGVDEIAKEGDDVIELVPLNDVSALAKKFIELKSDLNKRESLSVRGKEHAENNFSLDKMLRRTEEAFIETYNQRSSLR
ncbi:MAG: glycosyltransferase family 4 protein [Candidatus Marinimicrobia bacterium]|nr:glycosyltransferase family 4 protein [Candidatus Neomarinimicrobiota bacterium]